MSRVRRHVWVTGRVQGVFFRAATLEMAEKEGVHGWVRNLSDGRVEAVFEGSEASVGAAVEWCHVGSPPSRVDKVDVADEPPEQIQSFRILH